MLKSETAGMTFTKRIFVVTPTHDQFKRYQREFRDKHSASSADLIFLSDPKQLYGFMRPTIHFYGDLASMAQDFLQEITNLARTRYAEMIKV